MPMQTAASACGSDSDGSGVDLMQRLSPAGPSLRRGLAWAPALRRAKVAGVAVLAVAACAGVGNMWTPRVGSTGGRSSMQLGSGIELAGAGSRQLRDEKLCHDNEERWGALCYKKCSDLTGGRYPIRTTAMTCCESHPCKLSNQVHDVGVCSGYSVAGDGASCPHPPGECFDDEELVLGICYKKCSILTNGTHPYRVAAASCCSSKGFMGMCLPWKMLTSKELDVGGGRGDLAKVHSPLTELKAKSAKGASVPAQPPTTTAAEHSSGAARAAASSTTAAAAPAPTPAPAETLRANTARPTSAPTSEPTSEPTAEPTAAPTAAPTSRATAPATSASTTSTPRPTPRTADPAERTTAATTSASASAQTTTRAATTMPKTKTTMAKRTTASKEAPSSTEAPLKEQEDKRKERREQQRTAAAVAAGIPDWAMDLIETTRSTSGKPAPPVAAKSVGPSSEAKTSSSSSTTKEADSRDLQQQLPYDCDGGTKSSDISWSKGKKDWCCRHRELGCERSDAKVSSWGGDRTS